MVASIEPRAGGAARFDTGDGAQRGTVAVWDPPRALGYLWPFPADGEAHVAWSLEPLDDGARTRLVLEHTQAAGGSAAGYGSGWHAYLDRLAASLAGQQPPDWRERAAELRAAYDAAA